MITPRALWVCSVRPYLLILPPALYLATSPMATFAKSLALSLSRSLALSALIKHNYIHRNSNGTHWLRDADAPALSQHLLPSQPHLQVCLSIS